MSGDQAPVVIVGAGVAGARCAEALRGGGHTGGIVVFGDESHGPYDRPALSKHLLVGSRSPDDLVLREPAFWVDQRIELRLDTPIQAIDLDRRLVLSQAGPLAFSALVLAMGSRARRLSGLPEADGLHYLRSLREAVALRDGLAAARRIVIAGAGFIGLEVASSARALGVDVVVIDPAETPFSVTLGREVGTRLGARAASNGVDLRLATSLARVHTAAGAVRSVELADGSRVECDLLVVGVGAQPNTELVAGRLELAADGGIATDRVGRTRVRTVFACGDVASPHRDDADGCARLEHWSAAAATARSTADAILGIDRPSVAAPYFWTDQFGWRVQSIGRPAAELSISCEGDTDAFVARYHDRDGALRAAVVANRPELLGGLRRELQETRLSPAA
jgi:3-phenylpropionate/trans-cinnamate dioxygenase ferredoxin reductase component